MFSNTTPSVLKSPTLSLGEAVSSISRATASVTPSPSRSDAHAVLVDQSLILVALLERPLLQLPWGMSLSKSNSGLIILSDFPPSLAFLRGCWTAPTTAATVRPLSHWLFHKNVVTPHAVLEATKQVVQYRHHPPQQQQQQQQRLLPGDVIVAANGRSLHGVDLPQITQYMRSCKQLSLLVIRYLPAIRAALQQPTSYEASLAADHVLQRLLSLPQQQCRPPQQQRMPPARVLFSVSSSSSAAHPAYSHQKPKKQPSQPRDRVVDATTTSTTTKTTVVWTGGPCNPLFRDATTNEPLPYCDNHYEYEPDERASLFLDTDCQTHFGEWLQKRKRKWRSERYKVYPYTEQWVEEEAVVEPQEKQQNEQRQRHESSVAIDFWTRQGYTNFEQWLHTSTTKWKQSYSWNQRKRQRLEQDCEEVVHLMMKKHNKNGGGGGNTTTNFYDWLRVRKSQWRVLRRKRQRATRGHYHHPDNNHNSSSNDNKNNENDAKCCESSSLAIPATTTFGTTTAANGTTTIMPHQLQQPAAELLAIDAILEAQEEERRVKETRPPLDIMALFDFELSGCPDDALAHCLTFLDPLEHGKLLCINSKARQALMERQHLWQQLCPSHWTLPRRPRKPWHELYLGMLRAETEASRKRWDDLLMKASNMLFKGDQLQSIEKLVTKGERNFRFHVNYISGVVCERNSLLNLAVINGRHKVARWLVEVKQADVESYDRGNFTPLLNAAWAGDRYLVRYLLGHGADRSKVGMFHYTKPLSSPDFEGLTAEGWAEKKGFADIAKLIRLGL